MSGRLLSYSIPIHAGVSATVTLVDTTYYLSVLDLIRCVNQTEPAHEIWNAIPKEELHGTIICPQHTTMITLAGALKLIQLVPGPFAVREHVATMITHFVAQTSEVPVASTVSSIPFDEIMPGAAVRLTVINGTQYLSIRDIIMHVCGKNVNEAGEVWRNVTNERKKEVHESVLTFKFPGRGQQDQPVITFPGALKLIMFLPGKNAQALRSKMVTILTRYFAGDPSLLKEIEANARSESPVNLCAREALEGQHIEDTRKRKREELENLKTEAELSCSIIEKYASVMDKFASIIDTYTALCLNPDIDDRAKTMFKEMLLRVDGI